MTAVPDASALLVVPNETGAATVEPAWRKPLYSAVKWCEVVPKAASRGVNVSRLRDEVEALGVHLAAFDADALEATAQLWTATNDAGPSLGDRGCLALAPVLGTTGKAAR